MRQSHSFDPFPALHTRPTTYNPPKQSAQVSPDFALLLCPVRHAGESGALAAFEVIPRRIWRTPDAGRRRSTNSHVTDRLQIRRP